jgi:hypothetical protein
MIIRVDDYVKSWPWGFVKYDIPSNVLIPDDTRCFLEDVGLPKGREPEWVFTGTLQQNEHGGYVFGVHATASLVVTKIGAVYESINGDLTFLNSGVRELALCMTFRKKNSRGRFPINTESDFVAFQQSILAIDPNALSPGTYWWFYAEEVRSEALDSDQ